MKREIERETKAFVDALADRTYSFFFFFFFFFFKKKKKNGQKAA